MGGGALTSQPSGILLQIKWEKDPVSKKRWMVSWETALEVVSGLHRHGNAHSHTWGRRAFFLCSNIHRTRIRSTGRWKECEGIPWHMGKNFSAVLASRRRDGKRSCRTRRRSLGGPGRKRALHVQQRCEAARDVEGMRRWWGLAKDGCVPKTITWNNTRETMIQE